MRSAALGDIGLRQAVISIGNPEPTGTIRDSSGRLLITVNQDLLSQDAHAQTLIVRRSDLQHLLLDAASHLPIRLNTPAERIRSQYDSATVDLASAAPYVHRSFWPAMGSSQSPEPWSTILRSPTVADLLASATGG